MNKFYTIIIVLFLVSIMSSSCKKPVKEKSIVRDTDIFKVFDLPGDAPFSYAKKTNGGYFLVYGEIIKKQRDISVAVTDNYGNVIHKTTFGGSKNEVVWLTQIDAEGNLYLCGFTQSAELRMDKNASLTNSSDGYLAKVDKDGNLLWQRGYCDTTSAFRGANNDGFRQLYLMNNKIYCIGSSSSWHQPLGNGQIDEDAWLVTFDVNGNFIKDQILPSLSLGNSISNFTGYVNIDGIKIDDDNLIIRYNFMDYQSQGRNMDTTSLLYRYNTSTNSVLWINYYNRLAPQGDICWGGLLSGGNICYFDSYWNTISVLDVNNGNVLSTTTVNNNTPGSNSNQYFSNIAISPLTIGENLYFMGYSSIGGITANQKPFMAKLDKNGALVYNKTFDISNASFYWVTLNENNGLQILGKINYFNSDNFKLFTVNADENGNIPK